MNLALGPVALAAALSTAAQPEPAPDTVWKAPDYAVQSVDLPCVGEPCGGALLTDFRFALGTPDGATEGKVRLRLLDRLYLGVRSEEAGQELSLNAARWDLAIRNDNDRIGVDGEYRAPRVRVRTLADRFDRQTGDGWRLGLEAAIRVSRDLELIVGLTEDERSRLGFGPSTRPTSGLSVGALWQHGARLELSGRLSAATVETPAGFELDSRRLAVAAVYQARRWHLATKLGFEDLAGRFARREADGEIQLTYRITGHLVAAATVRERYELDLGSIEYDVATAVTYYARRFQFARGAAAGAQTVELVRRAREAGLNERRRHDLEGRRQLRERLGLARREGAGLESSIGDLYRAQVDERNVALGGIRWHQDDDNLDGSRRRELAAFFAVPWANGRGPRPMGHDETAADFLRFTYSRVEHEVSAGFSTEGSTLAMDISLNRELALRFAWENPAGTGLQFAFQSQEPGRLTARVDYRLGL